MTLVSRPAMEESAPAHVAPDATSTRPANLGASPVVPPSGGPNSPAAMSAATPSPCPPQGSPTISRPATELTASNEPSPDATSIRPTMPCPAPSSTASGGPTSPAAILLTEPKVMASQGNQATGRHHHTDAQTERVAGSGAPDPAAACSAKPTRPAPLDPAPRGQGAEHPSTPSSASLLDPALCLAADILDDLERVRIANENRLRQLTRVGIDKDGEERGFGLDESHPDVARLAAMVATLKAVEHDATLELQRKLRKHPLGAWVKAQRGVGEKQGARLLAAIGDPYINSAKGASRTVSALWAYCGLHVLAGGQGDPETHKAIAASNQLPGGQVTYDVQQLVAAGGGHRDTDLTQADAQRRRVGVADGGNPGLSRVDAQKESAGVAAKRRKGERANWSTKAKMRAYLIAESCIKQLGPDCRDGQIRNDAHMEVAVPAENGAGRDSQLQRDDQLARAVAACACSPYRVKYDTRRAHTAVTHPEWTDGHSHNDALRIASKEILKDLWRAARDWHQERAA